MRSPHHGQVRLSTDERSEAAVVGLIGATDATGGIPRALAGLSPQGSASQLREPVAEGADGRVVSMLAQVLAVERPDPPDVLPRSQRDGQRQRLTGTARALNDLTCWTSARARFASG
jgi:hypothetical protein